MGGTHRATGRWRSVLTMARHTVRGARCASPSLLLAFLALSGCERPQVRACGSGTMNAIASGDRPSGPDALLWPNEPAGFTVVTDQWFTALNHDGWRGQQRETTNGSGLIVASHLAGPASTDGVLQFTYAPGFAAGREPGVEFYDLPTPTKAAYFAFWWKPSDPWQPHASGVNKIAFLMPVTSGAGSLYLMMFFDGSRYTIQVEPTFAGDTRRLAPNVTATPVVLGAWHRIEWYARYNTTDTTRDGVTRWWLDGVLQGSYRDLEMPRDDGFLEFQLAPTWGGVGGVKARTDCYWYEHAHISRP
jgi:hypothetical protein